MRRHYVPVNPSRAVQQMLDALAARIPRDSVRGRLARALSRGWTGVWLVLVTAVAAAVAWVAAAAVGVHAPVPASAAALLTVTLSVHRSLKSGLGLLIATAAALLIAWGLYAVWGLHVWSIAALVIVALVIGRLLKLGTEGSMQVPATALFLYALGSQLTPTVAVDRIVATLIGVAVGVAFSTIAHPETAVERVTTQLADLGDRLGRLLVEIGSAAPLGYTRAEAESWLITSRGLSHEMRELGDELEKVGLVSSWSVSGPARQRHEVVAQYDVLSHTCSQVNGIARALFDAAADGQPVVPRSIGNLLDTTGRALTAHAAALPEVVGDGEPDTGVLQAVGTAADQRTESVSALKSLDDTGALILSSSIVADVDRMLDQLSGPSEALDVADRPQRPARTPLSGWRLPGSASGRSDTEK